MTRKSLLMLTDLSLQVAEYEATTFSIFYNNSLFLALVIIASFYILSVSLPVPESLYLIIISNLREPPDT